MSTPLIFILLPLLVSMILMAIRRWRRVTGVIGSITTLAFGLLAWWIPIGEITPLGLWSIQILDRIVVLGRQFVLGEEQRSVLMLVYIITAFWFVGALAAQTRRVFVPLGLSVVALMIAAIAVEPFVLAALLIELAVLISIPILSPPGEEVGRGVQRFLVFQSLGMPLILLAGWMLTGVDTPLDNPQMTIRAVLVLGLGFAFLLAIFPFHTWVPMLAKEVDPYSAAFVFSTLLGIGVLFGFSFFDRYTWLTDLTGVYEIVRISGVLMIALGGVWAAFQRHLGRMLGYAVILETGRSLVAMSTPLGVSLYYVLLIPRILALGVWALALSLVNSYADDLGYPAVGGVARRFPVVGASVIVANFTLAGFPLLAGFPVYLTMWEQLAQASPHMVIWTVLGSLGLMMGGLRSLAVLVSGPEEIQWERTQHLGAQVLLVISLIGLVLVGLFPQWFTPILAYLPGNLEMFSP